MTAILPQFESLSGVKPLNGLPVALIGEGRWGKILRRYIETDTQFELRRIFARSRQPVGIYTNDLKALMADPEIRAVFIATPPATHYEYAMAAILSGKHVFCEKPLTLNKVEAMHLRNCAADRGLVLMTDYTYTFSPGISEFLRHFENVHDKAHHISMYWHKLDARERAEDVLWVLGSHALSILHMMLDLDGCDYELASYNAGAEGHISLIGHSISVNISLSLRKEPATRAIAVRHADGILVYDGIGKHAVQQHTLEKIVTLYAGDESNNLKHAVQSFGKAITGEVMPNIGTSVSIVDVLTRRRV